ncbi:MAG: hypothetical protein DRG59_11240, partial [Deltaproteobacteria bacterium]
SQYFYSFLLNITQYDMHFKDYIGTWLIQQNLGRELRKKPACVYIIQKVIEQLYTRDLIQRWSIHDDGEWI